MVNKMTTQNKTNPDGEVVKVLLLKDKDGIEALRAETKAYLAGFFEDTANDYFDGGTVWEDERFLLVMEDGSVFEILDFKNKTAAKKAFKKAVAVLYYGSSDLVAWINEKLKGEG